MSVGSTFQDRLNYLFAMHLSPDGDEYTPREVNEGTGGKITPPHLSRMRAGKVRMPGGERLQALAAFFGVPVDFLIGHVLAHEASSDEDEELREILRNPTMREFARQTREFDVDEWNTLLEMIKLIERRRARDQRREVSSSTLEDEGAT